MKVDFGKGTSAYGTGVEISLSGAEVATAIDAYLVAHGIHTNGPRTVTVNGSLCAEGSVYVDPSGFVNTPEKRYDGNNGCSQWAYVPRT